jgi:type IV secretory pathway VirJ component
MRNLIFCLLFLVQLPALFAKEESLAFKPFGKITLYYKSPHPANVVLFISGDGGWNLGVVEMARELVSLDTLVVGIDINTFVREIQVSRERCLYPAADLEALSKFVQMKLNYPRYRAPVLVGYSSGATLVYATLVQAPPDTFLGGISMGFCPDLSLAKPMCPGSGLQWTEGPKGKGYNFLPAKSLEVPWIALQGTIDQVCEPKSTEDFVKDTPQGQIVVLPKVGHGFSVPKNWMPQFKKAFTDIIARENKGGAALETSLNGDLSSLSDLPLEQVPASGGNSKFMGIIITGDGGWGVTDRGIARSFAAKGIPVVGLNSLHYFWSRKTPEQSAADLNRVLQYYSSLWKRTEVVVIGYSFGADVLPFMLTRIPGDALKKIKVIAFLGPSSFADFQFHLTDWISSKKRATSLPVLPEIEKLRGKRMICFYGTEDDDAVCDKLDRNLARTVAIQGGHRLGKGYQPIVDAILEAAQ